MRSKAGGVEAALVDAAAVVAVWAVMVLVEALVVSLWWRGEFSAAWEIVLVRRLAGPLAIAGLAPASLVVVGWWRVACLARDGARPALAALAVLGALAGGALAVGVSSGRHFASWGRARSLRGTAGSRGRRRRRPGGAAPRGPRASLRLDGGELAGIARPGDGGGDVACRRARPAAPLPGVRP